MLLALGILAMTVGLIRSEAAGDVRTLTATGASSTTRRMLTAATASGLALLGVALGTAGAYAAVVAGFVDVADLTPIPVVHLAAIAIGTPVAAAAAGWLLAGREPSRHRPPTHRLTSTPRRDRREPCSHIPRGTTRRAPRAGSSRASRR